MEVFVILCALAGEPQCETYKQISHMRPLPHNCMSVGQQIAARYMRQGLKVKKIGCRRFAVPEMVPERGR